MKKLLLFCLITFSWLLQAQNNKIMDHTIYQFKVKDIQGKDFDLSTLRGKKVMIVNTASKCGFTPQYKQLQELYSLYKEKDFVIIGFPANNFAGQEPGSDKEIAAFCEANYGVDFPMMSKISVKGADMHPLYHFLTEKSKNNYKDSEVQWNFQKYLIDEEGRVARVIDSKTLPTDKSIIDWIEN
ncbi:glutathione peroxidase [Zunongwangia sp. H14]|uniref:glutathione peroxidase n=1 Tax=Zunongwangia sp. H14 TaxID=3240792 RepID=UPI0035695F18